MEKMYLTGEPGVGKSTILGRVREKYPTKVAGIIASEIRDAQGIRLGFTSGTLDNPGLVTIAHVDDPSDIRVSRYGINIDALNSLSMQLAEQLQTARGKQLVLLFDEVGLMQSYSNSLKAQIEEVITGDVPAILTIRQDDSVSDWLKDMKRKPDTHLLTITPENRDQIFAELSAYIEKSDR